MPVFDIHTWLGGGVVPGVAGNASQIVNSMAAREVEGAIVFSAHAMLADATAGNRILKSTIDPHPNLYGGLVTHTNRIPQSIAIMRELMLGKKFLGMLITSPHPEQPLSRYVADELINAYRRYSKPLFLPTPTAAHVHVALDIAKEYPMLKVICLGMGGSEWRAAINAAHYCPNLLLETSGELNRTKLAVTLEVIGFHRILFGSGSPHVDSAASKGVVTEAELPSAVKEAILYGNADKVFRLHEEEYRM